MIFSGDDHYQPTIATWKQYMHFHFTGFIKLEKSNSATQMASIHVLVYWLQATITDLIYHVRYGIVIRVYASRKFWRILISRLYYRPPNCQIFRLPPNLNPLIFLQ